MQLRKRDSPTSRRRYSATTTAATTKAIVGLDSCVWEIGASSTQLPTLASCASHETRRSAARSASAGTWHVRGRSGSRVPSRSEDEEEGSARLIRAVRDRVLLCADHRAHELCSFGISTSAARYDLQPRRRDLGQHAPHGRRRTRPCRPGHARPTLQSQLAAAACSASSVLIASVPRRRTRCAQVQHPARLGARGAYVKINRDARRAVVGTEACFSVTAPHKRLPVRTVIGSLSICATTSSVEPGQPAEPGAGCRPQGGHRGDAGPAGPQGETGPAGLQGEQGETGTQGPRRARRARPAPPVRLGPAGPQGGTGPAGLQGPTGATGPQGPEGATCDGRSRPAGWETDRSVLRVTPALLARRVPRVRKATPESRGHRVRPGRRRAGREGRGGTGRRARRARPAPPGGRRDGPGGPQAQRVRRARPSRRHRRDGRPGRAGESAGRDGATCARARRPQGATGAGPAGRDRLAVRHRPGGPAGSPPARRDGSAGRDGRHEAGGCGRRDGAAEGPAGADGSAGGGHRGDTGAIGATEKRGPQGKIRGSKARRRAAGRDR